MCTPPGWGLEHKASNPISLKNLTAIETSTTVTLLRPYVPVGTKEEEEEEEEEITCIDNKYFRSFFNPMINWEQ
jgi:hypothetical protein